MSEIDYAARVANGAALLDEKRPGWEREIDLSVLDVGSPTSCVTAQLSGVHNFREGQRQLELDDASYIAYGFNAHSDCACCAPADLPENYTVAAAYDALNLLWRQLIKNRLSVSSEA